MQEPDETAESALVRADDRGAAPSTRLSFVRHAESRSNIEQRIRGQATCTGLTPRGRDQAALLAQRVAVDHADDPVTWVYSTPLARAVQTARPVADALGLTVHYLPSWRYTDYGAADGRSWGEVYKAFPAAHPALHPDRPIADGAETIGMFRDAVRTAIAELVRRHRGEHVLVFGSTENLMAAEEVLLDLPLDSRCRSKLAIDHTGIMTWDLLPTPWSPAQRRAVLVRHNDSSHLPGTHRHSRFRVHPKLGS